MVTSAERTVYILDDAGNRTREDLQRWDGSQWVIEATTSYLYTTRCRLDQVLHPDGSITEHAYDCNGNLERTWDANHPSARADDDADRHLRLRPAGPAGDRDAAVGGRRRRHVRHHLWLRRPGPPGLGRGGEDECP
jgi:hypothetical protein